MMLYVPIPFADLEFNCLKTSSSQQEQQGYMMTYAEIKRLRTKEYKKSRLF